MKKNFILLLVMIIGTLSYSQQEECNIFTPLRVTIGQTVTFSVPSGTAQCDNCYNWNVSNNNAVIVGSDTENSVQIHRTGSGGFFVSVSYLNDEGCQNCEVYVPPVDDPTCSYALTGIGGYLTDSCDLYQTSKPVILSVYGNFPSGTTYNWTTILQDGSSQFYTTTSSTKMFTVLLTNRIVSVSVEATYENCTKEVSREWLNCPLPQSDCDDNLFYGCANPPLDGNPKRIKVYPNPTTSFISFEDENLDYYSITISDSMGNVIIKDEKLTEKISLQSQKPGVYLYTISDKKGYRQEGKIIKE